MTDDLQERLRRSLATRADDVRPDPATWERVQARLRRRAWARWSLAGLTAAAALVLAALTLPGLFGGTRVDLSPADPGPVPSVVRGLVHTDGRQIVLADGDREVVVAALNESSDQSISRLAVRPGSTADDLAVAYLVAGPDCDRAQMRWASLTRVGTGEDGLHEGQEGFLDEGGDYCITDPAWAPDGSVAAWVRQGPPSTDTFEVDPAAGGDLHTLIFRGWFDDGADIYEPHASNQFSPLDLSPLAAGQPPVRALRVTGWQWAGDQGTLHLSAAHDDGRVTAGRIGPIPRPGNPGDSIALPVQPQVTDDPNDPGAYPSTLVEPVQAGETTVLLTVSDHSAPSGPDPRTYSLVAGPTGGVSVERSVGDERATLELPAGVRDAENAAGAWLSAWGDTVVVGADGDAWVARWLGAGWGEFEALPGLVHADLMAGSSGPVSRPPPDPGEPGTRPADDLVTTDGQALTVLGREGTVARVDAEGGPVTDFAVHPQSTADDVTVVWREGTGCAATLRYTRVLAGDVAGSGTVTAQCPGRPAFSPDGRHLAWVSDTGLTSGAEFALETMPWSDGPGESVTTFGLPADPAELGHLTLLDWTWAAGGAAADGPQAAGLLHLAGTDSHGTVSALTAPVERQGDAALALPAGATAEQVTPFVFGSGQDGFAVLQVASGTPTGALYTLTRYHDDPDRALTVARLSEAERTIDELVLPPDLLRVNTTGAVDEVWMTARGDQVLLGDGAGRAWSVRWAAGGWGALQEVGGDVRYAVPLDPPLPPDPGPLVPDLPGPHAGLPEAVAAVRQGILEAAAAGDVDLLAALAGDQFTSSYGGPEDPRDFFTRLRDEGELHRLVNVLTLPHGEQDGVYSWPFAHTRDPSSLSSAELTSLVTIATQTEIDQWIASGSYLGWRAGIDADGTWSFYVAGD